MYPLYYRIDGLLNYKDLNLCVMVIHWNNCPCHGPLFCRHSATRRMGKEREISFWGGGDRGKRGVKVRAPHAASLL